MKKSMLMCAMTAALCGVAFTSCSDDEEPGYLEVTGTTASSITIEVNSDGAYGYFVGVLSVADVETITALNDDDFTSGSVLTDDQIKFALGQGLYSDSNRKTGSSPITFTTGSKYFYGYYGGDAIAAGTKYYVGVADAYVQKEATADSEAEYNFDSADIQYVLVTTPAE